MDLGKYFPLSNDLVFGKVMANKETCKLFFRPYCQRWKSKRSKWPSRRNELRIFAMSMGAFLTSMPWTIKDAAMT